MDANGSQKGGSSPPPGSSLFDGRQFRNLDGAPAGRSFLDAFRWKFLGSPGIPWPAHPAPDAVPPNLAAEVRPGEMAATFVGHSTFLLQFDHGLNVLIDPIWSERASPVSFAGPRRARPPALAFEALPPIAAVLVTHGHYDHLDVPTLRRLEERFHPLFLTGLGQGALLRASGLQRIEELDWWQSWPLPDLELTFTPAQHWSARSLLDRNRALWGGFWLRQRALQVFYAGDSGLGRHFSLIRERLGVPDVAFLPIGAYEPRWFMREQHMNPDEAVQTHLTLGASTSVAMHFGTFRLTDEGIDDPARALAASLRDRGVSPAGFLVPGFGQTLAFRHSAPSI
jgi:L-ascorbate metabolism protein UlaG (beta-lactamase superfamily)